jgi:hypothetical protein
MSFGFGAKTVHDILQEGYREMNSVTVVERERFRESRTFDSVPLVVMDFSQDTKYLLNFIMYASGIALVCFLCFGVSTKKGFLRTVALLVVWWIIRACILGVVDAQEMVSTASAYTKQNCVGVYVSTGSGELVKKCLNARELLEKPMIEVQADFRNEHLLDFIPSIVDNFIMKVLLVLTFITILYSGMLIITRSPQVQFPLAPTRNRYPFENEDE